METVAYLIIGGLLGFGVAFFLRQQTSKKEAEQAKEDLSRLNREISEKRQQVTQAEQEAQKRASEILEHAKTEAAERKESIARLESKLEAREESMEKKEKVIDEKIETLETQRETLKGKEEEIATLKKEAEEIVEQQKTELEKVAKLKKEEAKELLLKKVEEEYRDDILFHFNKMEEEIKETAGEKAKKYIALAVQRYASETASEQMATVVQLPNDELKGRIIGREGRNINTFEQMTGIDVIVDDTPGSIVISGFDLVRRYVAKRSLEKLIEDGRIHPTRIEETVAKAREEVNEMIKEFGEKALLEMGVSGIHPDLVKIFGRLRFRTSYGQNILKHSMEVAWIAAALASEVGADIEVCKLGGLFHDIGKAVDHEIEGGHAMIGYEIAKKYHLPEAVSHAIGAHHEDLPMETAEDIIVAAADAISGARPGARRESMELYIKRLKQLEEAATSFEGVEKAFAIQAGREVRVIVQPEILDDLESKKLAVKIASKIEREMAYPGQIKVNIIRELRIAEFAK